MKNYWDCISDDERLRIKTKRNKSNSDHWKNMTNEEYANRCNSILVGRSNINQSEVSINFWKKMGKETRDLHAKKVSESRREYFNRIREISDMDISKLSKDDLRLIGIENNRKLLISENSKSLFEVVNILTGEVSMVKSVESLCLLVGCSKYMYKYNLRTKKYIINDYKFKKVKK